MHLLLILILLSLGLSATGLADSCQKGEVWLETSKVCGKHLACEKLEALKAQWSNEECGEIFYLGLGFHEDNKAKPKKCYLFYGEQKFSFPSHHEVSKAVYKFNNGLKEGEQTAFYKDGTIQSRTSYHQGLQDGKELIYYKDGVTQSEINYKSGKRDGAFLEYYSNGKKSREGSYRNGDLTGIVRNWNPDGSQRDEYSVKNGVLDGSFTIWRGKDQKYLTGQFVNGKKSGVHTYWGGSSPRSLDFNKGLPPNKIEGMMISGNQCQFQKTVPGILESNICDGKTLLCAFGDFDGNGDMDLAIVSGQRATDYKARVYLFANQKILKSVDLAPLGFIETRLPQADTGGDGAPYGLLDAIVDPGEGGDTRFFIWNPTENKFDATKHGTGSC